MGVFGVIRATDGNVAYSENSPDRGRVPLGDRIFILRDADPVGMGDSRENVLKIGTKSHEGG